MRFVDLNQEFLCFIFGGDKKVMQFCSANKTDRFFIVKV